MKYQVTTIAAVLIVVAACGARAADVKELWSKNCASCHGKDGRGQTPAGKKAGAADLTDGKLHEKFSDEAMFKAVKEGVKEGNKVKMKPAEKLSDAEIRRLISYLRGFKK